MVIYFIDIAMMTNIATLQELSSEIEIRSSLAADFVHQDQVLPPSYRPNHNAYGAS